MRPRWNIPYRDGILKSLRGGFITSNQNGWSYDVCTCFEIPLPHVLFACFDPLLISWQVHVISLARHADLIIRD